jgi:hypothetical protein
MARWVAIIGEGQTWDKAVAYLRLAGRQGAARGAYRDGAAPVPGASRAAPQPAEPEPLSAC